MADNLPLIPGKESVCADVRPVLREVFKELDFLPPLSPERLRPKPVGSEVDSSSTLPSVDHWIVKYDLDRKGIWSREGELQQKYAKRLARDPLPNIYKLYQPLPNEANVPIWKSEQGILDRKDLMPSMIQHAVIDDCMWVKNILDRSSGDLTSLTVVGTKVHDSPIHLDSKPIEASLESISMGAQVSRIQRPISSTPPSPPTKQVIFSVPPQLEFINFTVGQMYTKEIRLVNVTKFEIRLSIRPPSRRELDIELGGTRGLTVTSGAAAEIRVNFKPSDVRVLQDVLMVRVSMGKTLYVPINCYMQPPLLDILVPAVSSSIFSCTPGFVSSSVARSTDCLDLGSRLLGDVHCVPVMYHCEFVHASFFLLPEDSWLSFSLDSLTSRGSVLAPPFVMWPAWWQGGGVVRGCVWCRPDCVGLHAVAFRIISSTAVIRPLHLLADALYYRPEHITLEAQDKDYDICADDDPACEYYVHLSTAFPRRSLSTTVQLVNHSPVMYNYYWSVRPWGVCSCWEEEQALQGLAGSDDDDRLCVGAKEAKDQVLKNGPNSSKSTNANYLRVEPARGTIAPQSSCGVHVCVPDVGSNLGVQRAVLMLVLQDIPNESFPSDFDPMIIKTESVESHPIPGVKGWTREVCEVVCTQMEVWWEVAPVRFVLDPPILPLVYSRRVEFLNVTIRATQLFGCEGISCSWQVPEHVPPPPAIMLTSSQSCVQTLKYPLPMLPNEYPETDVIILEAAASEWMSQSLVTRQVATRHPALRPARVWLGTVPPTTHLHASVEVANDTYQHICWWAEAFRWYGENPPHAACAGDNRVPCPSCLQLDCTCGRLRPARGALHHEYSKDILYDVNTPVVDGIVATLVRVRRTGADVAQVAGGAGSDARASLLAYRVLAPRLVLRVRPCAGEKYGECDACALDEADHGSERGTATLRPGAALSLGRRTCYRLRFTNLTPLPTRVKWDPALEEDALKVMFIPKEFNVGGYAQVETQVVLEARKVCGRRLFVHRAQVLHAYKPVYLVIDTAIAGLEILCEVPLGGGENTDTVLIMPRLQAEIFPWDAGKWSPSTPEEIFEEEDRQREERTNRECRCRYEIVYIEPEKRPRPPPATEDAYPPVEIVWEPPPLTRICRCCASTEPLVPELAEAACLQFQRLPIRTVRSRTITVRNESVLSATWSAAVRNWPRLHTRTLNEDQWASDVCESGAVVQYTPSSGVLSPRGRLDIRVRVYADCWGLYRDQLLIKIDNLESIVLDVWIEVVGAPLQFAINLGDRGDASPVLCWMSSSDPTRSLRAKNVSRAELTVHSYTTTAHEHAQDELPFRLYLRLYDVPPKTCPCDASLDCDSVYGESSSDSGISSYVEEMDTEMELYLSPDYGLQDNSFYKVTPETTTIAPGTWMTWSVKLLVPHLEVAPASSLLLRAIPTVKRGDGWYRPDPPAQLVELRQSVRKGHLQLSCHEVTVHICALDLPYNDTIRIRKRFRVQNIGNGPLEINARTKEPWTVIVDEEAAGVAPPCCCHIAMSRQPQVPLYLLPRSSLEVCVEVHLLTSEVWPLEQALEAEAGVVGAARDASLPSDYKPHLVTNTCLYFFDTNNIIKSIPLILDIEFPKLSIEPSALDFGFVTAGDTRKSYFTVAHSSPLASVEVVMEWIGGAEFRLWPKLFTLPPAARQRIYIQYTAKWSRAPVEGQVRAAAAAGGGAWCRAVARARAQPTRDLLRRHCTHDFTDDTHLLPPSLHS